MKITTLGRMEVTNLPMVDAEVAHAKSHSSHPLLLPAWTLERFPLLPASSSHGCVGIQSVWLDEEAVSG